MSSTNRGGVREVSDYYCTPHKPIRDFLNKFLSLEIGFTDDGKTDSIEYMHCVWQKGYKTDHTKLFII